MDITKTLVDEFELTKEDFLNEPLPATVKSGPQVEKLIPKKRQPEFNKRLIFKPRGALIVVGEEDSRNGVTPDSDPGEDFSDEKRTVDK